MLSHLRIYHSWSEHQLFLTLTPQLCGVPQGLLHILSLLYRGHLAMELLAGRSIHPSASGHQANELCENKHNNIPIYRMWTDVNAERSTDVRYQEVGLSGRNP